MPTEIEYRERINPPYQSYRKVEVYGKDCERRLERVSKEVDAFEKALTSVVNQIKEGKFFKG